MAADTGNDDDIGNGLRDIKGVQSFLPSEQMTREYIVDTLKRHFRLYGYRPIETSILDFYNIAASKYAGGAEILKETYRLKDQGNRDLILRYELTFKLAKLIGMNPNLRMPFKRYEIGKVFRDGPTGTGRLREFTQCDVDVVGTASVLADAEIIALAFDIFRDFGIDVYIEVNSRNLMFGIFERLGIPERNRIDAALSLDKLLKIGESGVRNELLDKGISKDIIDGIFKILGEADSRKSNEEKLEYLESIANNSLAKTGVAELKEFFGFCASMHATGDLRLTPTLVRGLGYYTGIIYEVYLEKGKMKSTLAAGGRWDHMIKDFLKSDREYPATGITFGLDSIYAALQEKKASLPEAAARSVPVLLIIPVDTMEESLKILQQARGIGISADILPGKKLTKALEYANSESIPYTMVVGKKELEIGSVKLRDMHTGKEREISLSALKSSLTLLKDYGAHLGAES